MGNAVIDLIIRIKNGYMSKKQTIESPYSKFRLEVLKKLKSLGYIADYRVNTDRIKTFTIDLEYKEGVPALTDVKIYSTPGKRWYVSVKELKPVLGGLGVSILSTPAGVLTNKEAKKKILGGELLFDIW